MEKWLIFFGNILLLNPPYQGEAFSFVDFRFIHFFSVYRYFAYT